MAILGCASGNTLRLVQCAFGLIQYGCALVQYALRLMMTERFWQCQKN
jgi:hypothetical protein